MLFKNLKIHQKVQNLRNSFLIVFIKTGTTLIDMYHITRYNIKRINRILTKQIKQKFLLKMKVSLV